jgi:hypothetical protein
MRPGVYVQEAPLPRIIEPSSVGLTAGAFVGTALKGPEQPVLVPSWSQFVALFGSFSSDDARTSLAPAVYQFFANGGGQCYICRALPGDAEKARVVLSTQSGEAVMEVEALSPGYWGNGVAVDVVHPFTDSTVSQFNDATGPFSIEFEQEFDRARDWNQPLVKFSDATTTPFDLVVRNTVRGVSVVVERYPRLSLDPQSPRYAPRIINDSSLGSQYVTVTDVNSGQTPTWVPAVQEKTYLTNGSDGQSALSPGDWIDAVSKFDSISGNLVFNIPGIHEVSGVEQKIEERGDSFLVVDAPNLADISKVLETSFPTSSYAAVYYPWIGIADPDPSAQRGAVKWVPPGGSVVGMILRTDASRGSFKAPAGIGASLTGAVATSKRLSNAELDTLNNYQVNAIRPVIGSGITVMGARTRDFSTTARYISVRRTLNWIKGQAKSVSEFALFEPNTPSLWEQLRVANGAFLSELWQVGGLAGRTFSEGFYVKIDSDNNPPSAIANGEIHIEIGVAPVFPSEFVIIRIGQFEADASFVVTEE